jgi:hypothetical protein
MLLPFLLLAWSTAGQVLDGSFTDLSNDWQSGIVTDKSLVSTPELDFINDTAVTFVWTLRTNDEIARLSTNYDIEISLDLYSDDFRLYASVPTLKPDTFSNNSYSSIYTVTNLQPLFSYRFRVCPTFSSGRGYCSNPLSVTTLASSMNYWEAILSRRNSMVGSGRGFSNPVVQRPHLDTGVEVREAHLSNDPERYSDPVTSETPVLPSGRRGHSLSLIDQTVYMFGGRTNGTFRHSSWSTSFTLTCTRNCAVQQATAVRPSTRTPSTWATPTRAGKSTHACTSSQRSANCGALT